MLWGDRSPGVSYNLYYDQIKKELALAETNSAVLSSSIVGLYCRLSGRLGSCAFAT